jgi:hypothetical protein
MELSLDGSEAYVICVRLQATSEMTIRQQRAELMRVKEAQEAQAKALEIYARRNPSNQPVMPLRYSKTCS